MNYCSGDLNREHLNNENFLKTNFYLLTIPMPDQAMTWIDIGYIKIIVYMK